MANKRANARAKASKMNANHSWPWVIVRISQISICVIALGLSVYLRFSYKPTSTLERRGEDDGYDDYSVTPPWLAPATTPGNSANDEFYHPIHGKWGFSPYVSLGILIAVACVSLLSSFTSLLLYCLDKLNLKLILILDFFLSVVWATGVVFIGKLITDNMGWGLNHRIANLYKLNFVLGAFAIILFIASGGLAIHLMSLARGPGGKYAPMTMAPPYKAPQSRSETGAPAPVFSTYTGPGSDPEHDALNKPAPEYR